MSWLRYLWLPFLAIGAVAGFYFFRKEKPSKVLGTELRAIKAEAEVKKLVAELGHEKAVKKIEDDHKETLQKLDEKEKKQAEELRKDPKKLSRFLVRASSGRR